MSYAAITPLIRSTEPFDLRKEDDFNYIYNLLSNDPLPDNVLVLAGIAPTQPEGGDVYLWQGILAQNSLIPVDHYKWRFYGRTLAPKGDSRVEKIFMRGAVIGENGQRGYLKEIKKHVYRLYGDSRTSDPSQPQRERRCLIHYLNTPADEMASDTQRTLCPRELKRERSQTSDQQQQLAAFKITSEPARESKRNKNDANHYTADSSSMRNISLRSLSANNIRPLKISAQQQNIRAANSARTSSPPSPASWTSRNVRRRRGASTATTPPATLPSIRYAAAISGSDVTTDMITEAVHDAVLDAIEPLHRVMHAVQLKLDAVVRRVNKLDAVIRHALQQPQPVTNDDSAHAAGHSVATEGPFREGDKDKDENDEADTGDELVQDASTSSAAGSDELTTVNLCGIDNKVCKSPAVTSIKLSTADHEQAEKQHDNDIVARDGVNSEEEKCINFNTATGGAFGAVRADTCRTKHVARQSDAATTAASRFYHTANASLSSLPTGNGIVS